ncbi:WD40-repeat-containing domain protein [Paraphysoderma sedebokerense]|nr:WD40-repeat-containing domain protein [Paraphysoderma sedebokerense]
MLSSPRPEDSSPVLTSDEITNYLTETVPQILDRHDAEKDKTLLQNIQSLNNVYRNVNSVINNSAPHFRFGARQDENTEKGPDHDAESTRPKIKWITSSHTDSKSVAANDRFPEFQYRGYIDLPASVSRNGCWAVKFDRYDPSGKRFAICGTKVVVLEATDDGNFAPLFIYPKTCFSLEFTYDEDDPTTSLLAIGGDEPVIHIVDCKTGVVRRRIVGPGGGIHSITFHPRHPSILACGSKDQSVQLINIKTGHLIAVFGGANGHRSEVVSVDITTSGSFLVSGGKDHSVRIWSLSSPQLKNAIENSYNYDHPTYRTGRLISDEPIFEISRFPPPIQYHHPVFLTYFLHWDIVDCVRFLTDGVALDELFLLSKSVDGCIMLWKPKNPKKWVAGTKDRGHAVDEILQFEYKVTSDTQWWPQFALDPSLTYLTVGSPRGYIYVWNIPDSIDEDKCFQRGKEKTEQWLQESEKSPSDLSIGGGRKSESDNVGKRGGTPTQEGANDGKENRNRNEWGTQGNDIWLKLGRYRAEPAEPLKLKFENKHNAQIESIAFNYGSSRILLALSSTGRLLRWDVSSSSTTVKSGDIDCKRTIVTTKGIPTSDVPDDSGLPTFPCWTHITRSRETPDDNVLRFLPQMPNLTGDEDEDDIDKKWQKILNENFDSFVFADLPLWRSGYFDVLVEAVEPLIRKYQIQEKRLRDDELNKILNSQFSSPVPQKVGKEDRQRQETTVRRLVWAITKLYGADAGVNVLSSICHKLSVTPVTQLEPDCPRYFSDFNVQTTRCFLNFTQRIFSSKANTTVTYTPTPILTGGVPDAEHSPATIVYLNGENPIAPYPPCKFPEAIPLPFAYRPCQPQCFKHFILSTPNLMALPRVDFDDGVKEMFELGVKHYGVDTVTINKNGQEMRQKDYSCSIAGMVDGRSCWEMYQYFIRNGYHSIRNSESSASSSPIISKNSSERKCDINDIHDSLSQYSMEIDQDVEEIIPSSGEIMLSDSEEVDIKIAQAVANEAKFEPKLQTGDGLFPY